ncbi:DUF4123 domain-containing protein [Vreelandella sp. EE7]
MHNNSRHVPQVYSPAGLPAYSEVIKRSGYYLLLDALAHPALESWLYEVLELPDYDVLYLKTPLKECRQASPCLVPIEHASAIWDAYVQYGGQQQWGWLLYSNAPRQALLAQLRWLLIVEHPVHGAQVLRLASPTVLHHLFSIEENDTCAEIFGTAIERAWIPVNQHGSITWWKAHNNKRLENKPPDFSTSFKLQESHLSALSKVNWQRFQDRLEEHLRHYFSSSPLIEDNASESAAAQKVIEITARLGFVGQRAHFYMANILGAYGEAALDMHKHPALAGLLLYSNDQTPMKRLKDAASLAQQALEKDETV